jgi:RNA polymerase sigma-70 factor (ECF subfamily)
VRNRRTPEFDEVFARYGAALWRLTAAYEREHAAREDLYQDILVALWKALPGYRGESSLVTFVFRVGHNRAMSHCARALARRVREEALPESVADPAPNADEHVDQALVRERLLQAVAALPLTLSQPMMLQLEGLSPRDIAETLGITENNAGVRLSRARSALRVSLGMTSSARESP